jgi:undecaprenyl-diphosphatase
MTIWQAFLLGIIQGITEFLPVSSSGHLALGQYLLGFDRLQDYILFDLVCHLGTLLSIFIYFFPLIKDKMASPPLSLFWQVILGTLPLIPLVLILKPLKAFFDQPQLLGPCFLASSALLFASLYWRFPIIQRKRPWQDPLTIGVFQAVAILPGISRSGATISAARLLGWQKEQALQFSFLLAIPAILGATVLEGWNAWQYHNSLALSAFNPWIFVVGFGTSFMIGCLALRLLIRWVIQDRWIYFAWYCLVIGIAATAYFNMIASYVA